MNEEDNCLFNPNKCSKNTLRKYENFFQLNVDIDSDNFEEILKKRCLEHFKNQFVIDDKAVIDKLLKLKKDERPDEGINRMYYLVILKEYVELILKNVYFSGRKSTRTRERQGFDPKNISQRKNLIKRLFARLTGQLTKII